MCKGKRKIIVNPRPRQLAGSRDLFQGNTNCNCHPTGFQLLAFDFQLYLLITLY